MVRVGTVVRILTQRGVALTALVLAALVFTTLALAKTNKGKTIVTYPSAYAVSQRLSELPIDLSPFTAQEMPEPRPSPLRSKAVGGPWLQEDPVLQKEVRPNVSATEFWFIAVPQPASSWRHGLKATGIDFQGDAWQLRHSSKSHDILFYARDAIFLSLNLQPSHCPSQSFSFFIQSANVAAWRSLKFMA